MLATAHRGLSVNQAIPVHCLVNACNPASTLCSPPALVCSNAAVSFFIPLAWILPSW